MKADSIDHIHIKINNLKNYTNAYQDNFQSFFKWT